MPPSEPETTPRGTAELAPVGELVDAVYRPAFRTVEGSIPAGTGFLCRLEPSGPLLFVTAHHLFGPAGGMSRTYAGTELARAVSGVDARSLGDADALRADRPLTIPDAAPVGRLGFGRDVAAFVVAQAPEGSHVLTVATIAPRVGARVFLLAEVERRTSLRHEATISEIGDDYVGYVFEDSGIALRATSGAPVVDADGSVVAINLAGGAGDDGRTFGFGGSVAAFVPRLRAALTPPR